MTKNKFGILILIFLTFTLGVNAQINTKLPNTSIDTNEVNCLDSIKCNLPDSFSDDNLDNILSDKLDSMVNTWYVQNAFSVDSLTKAYSHFTEPQDLPDSVYISRLQNLDSYISLPFNETVKKFIHFYLNNGRCCINIKILTLQGCRHHT